MQFDIARKAVTHDYLELGVVVAIVGYLQITLDPTCGLATRDGSIGERSAMNLLLHYAEFLSCQNVSDTVDQRCSFQILNLLKQGARRETHNAPNAGIAKEDTYLPARGKKSQCEHPRKNKVDGERRADHRLGQAFFLHQILADTESPQRVGKYRQANGDGKNTDLLWRKQPAYDNDRDKAEYEIRVRLREGENQ